MMNKVIFLALCLCLFILPNVALSEGSAPSSRTVESARNASFADNPPAIDIHAFAAQDPNFQSNMQAIRNQLETIDTRRIAVFYDPNHKFIQYSVRKQCSHYASFYDLQGKLVQIQYDPFDTCNVPSPPFIAYLYQFSSGKLSSIVFYANDKETYSFEPNKTLKSHWVADQCYDEDGHACGSRKAIANAQDSEPQNGKSKSISEELSTPSSEPWPLARARKEAFTGILNQPPVPISKFVATDPHFQENQRALASHQYQIGQRKITVEKTGYSVNEEEGEYTFFYDTKGHLNRVQYTGKSDHFPIKSYQYHALTGLVSQIGIYPSAQEFYAFQPDSTLLLHWQDHHCKLADGTPCDAQSQFPSFSRATEQKNTNPKSETKTMTSTASAPWPSEKPEKPTPTQTNQNAESTPSSLSQENPDMTAKPTSIDKEAVESARKIAMAKKWPPDPDFELLPLTDPNYQGNQWMLSRRQSHDEKRWITGYRKATDSNVFFYAVRPACSRYSYLYTWNGQLQNIDYSEQPLFCTDKCPAQQTFPMRLYRFNTKGPISVALYLNQDEKYIFQSDGTFAAHWLNHQCTSADGSPCTIQELYQK